MRPGWIAASMLASACSASTPTPETPAPSFNARVLALIDDYPAAGHGGYAWPAAPGTAGTTRDLTLASTVIARGGDGNHCVGVTLEVFWRALEACPGGAPAAFTPDEARAFKTTWYVPALGGAGAAEALVAHGLGDRVASLDDARPGDFVQAWAGGGAQGHSMVFLGWTRDDAGAITGIRYWSSQPWTDGIGVSETPVAASPDGFDPSTTYIARARCP